MDIREHWKEEGRQAGMEKGIQAGMEKGKLEHQQQVVRNMLKKQTDIAFISEVTGLSESEIRKYQNGDGRE